MISASHNPFGDNGIKFFAARWPEAVRRGRGRPRGRARPPAGRRRRPPTARDRASTPWSRPSTRLLPWATSSGGAGRCWSRSSGRRLDGLQVVDRLRQRRRARPSRPTSCAGSAPTVDVLHAEPDGRNINDRCGSTHPEDLQRAVVGSRGRGRPGLRRRCRPRPGGRRAGRAGRRRPPHRPVRARPPGPGPADRRRGRRDRDDEPGLPPGDGRARHRGGRDPGRAIATCSRRSSERGLALGGEQSGHVIFRRWPPRGTACSPACSCSTCWCGPAARSRSWPPGP